MTITRRAFLQSGAVAATALTAGRHQWLQAQSAEQLLGITLAHFEYDFDVVDDTGIPQVAAIQALGDDFAVVRFLNWQKTNVTWMRPPPGNIDQFWARETRDGWRNPPLHPGIDPPSIDWGLFDGVPLNVCLRFARAVGARPWICIPHGDSAAAFTPLMQTIVDQTLAGVNDGVKPIFEFSNEIWNGGFQQQQACARAQLGRDPVDGSERLSAALAYQIARTNEIADYASNRADTVIGAQTNNPYIAQTLVNGGLSENVTGLAIAPYFGLVRDGRYTRPDVLPNGFNPLIDMRTAVPFDLTAPAAILHEQLLDNLLAYIEAETAWALREHRQLLDTANQSRQNPLRLMAYESGPDLHAAENDANYTPLGDIDTIRELFLAFNRLPHMGFLVKRLRDLFFSAEIGGYLLNGYSSATVYKDRGRKSGKLNYDTFGYLEISAEEPRQYSKTWKYEALVGDFNLKRLGRGIQVSA